MSEETTNAPTATKRRRRPRLRMVLFSLALVLCGMIIGSGLTAHFIWSHVHDAFSNPEKVSERITHHLTRRLELTEEQSAQVGAIVTTRHQNLYNIREDTAPLIHDELEAMGDEIEAILTPEQSEEWLEMRDHLRDRWGGPPMRGPGGPGKHKGQRGKH